MVDRRLVDLAPTSFEAVLGLASLATWAFIVRGLALGEPVLEFSPRRPAPWGVMDVLALVGIYILSLAVALGVFRVGETSETETSTVAVLMATVFAGFLFVGAGTALLVRGRNATWADLGLPPSPSEALRDMALGAAGFLAALVPVFAVHAVATQYFPYEHPLLDLLKDELDPWLWLVATITAAVVAPITEEFYFRLVLQGWLEKVELAMWVAEQRAAKAEEVSNNPFTSPAEIETLTTAEAAKLAPGVFPMFLSAFLWAMMHLGHGPAPIPLFVMGLLLGYIFRETHRIIPCIVLHMLFNGLSLGVFWWTHGR